MGDHASPQLVWHLLRNNNAFMRKNLNNTWFSAEPGNLASKHNYKYSGLANPGLSVSPQLDDEQMGVCLRTTSKKGKAVESLSKKKSARRVIQSAGKQAVSYGRVDLKSAAMCAAGVSAAAVYRAHTEKADA